MRQGAWLVVVAMVLFGSWSSMRAEDPFIERPPSEPSQNELVGAARQLFTLRSATKLYHLQHDDRYPTTTGKPDGEAWSWDLMTQLAKGADGKLYGPYLPMASINPVNGSSQMVGKPTKGAGWLLQSDGQIFALNKDGKVIDDSKIVIPPAWTEAPSSKHRRSVLVSMVQVLRSATELYKLQHDDKYPTTSGKPIAADWSWEKLTGTSKAYDDRIVGPYLQNPMINPLTNSSEVVADPEKGAGFVLTTEGRIFALDEEGKVIDESKTVLPPSPSREDREPALLSMLQTLRSATELYKLQHDDKYPTTSGKPVAADWSWDLMTNTSKSYDGRIVGPYLQGTMVNPFTNSSKVVAKPQKGAGFVLTTEGRIYAIDEDGHQISR